MNYIESFNLFGTEAKEIPCIKGEGKPTETTEGAVGCLYMDILTGDLYKCVASNEGIYTWESNSAADQTYNPESENAQSGIAVDMAIKEAIQDARLDITNEISVATGDALRNHDIYFELLDVIDPTTQTAMKALALKPEYRGKGDTALTVSGTDVNGTISDNGVDEVGSAYDELPEVIKIPETIDGESYVFIIQGAFLNNDRIKTVVLPSGITQVSASSFKGCKNLQSVHNTASITSISSSAFEGTPLREAIFPNVKNIYDKAFKSCSLLKVAHFGGTVTRIRASAFNCCCSLERLTGCGNVSDLRDHALFYTYHLKETDIGQNVTNKTVTVRENAVMGCAFNFSANGVILNPYADKFCTREQNINISDWKDNIIPVTETKINPINRTFCQGDPKWIDRLLYGFDFSGGDSRVERPINYKYSCVINSFTNALFGILKDKGENLPYIPYSTDENIQTIEKELKDRFGENVFSDFLNWGESWGGITLDEGKLYKIINTGGTKYSVNPSAIIEYFAREKMSELLEIDEHFTFDGYNDNYTYNDVNNIYQALLDGKYVILMVPSGTDTTGGHAVLAYGIEATDNPTEPNILVTDTGLYHTKTGVYKPIKYKLPLNYFTATTYSYFIDSNSDGTSDKWVTYNLKGIPDSLEYPTYVIVSPKN